MDSRLKQSHAPLDWRALTDDLQLELARAALRRATSCIAVQAESLAAQIEAGWLADRGGADVLRLLAALVRTGVPGDTAAGHA
jgi:hypothetical protein